MSHGYESFRTRRADPKSTFEFAISKDHAIADPKYKLAISGRVAGQPCADAEALQYTRKATAAVQPGQSTIGTASPDGRTLGRVPVHPRYRRFMEQQELFLTKRHLPPWKAFPRDIQLFRGTLILGVAGLLYAAWGFNSLIHKK